jgi:hypothetical protein
VVECFNPFRLCLGMDVSHYPLPGKCEAVPVEAISARVPRGRVGAINTDAPPDHHYLSGRQRWLQ